MRYFILVLFILFAAGPSAAQTTLHGTILSTNEEPIPKVIIKAENQLHSDLFSDNTAGITEDGEFHLSFDNPGIYSVSISSVFHPTVRFPLLVYDQGSIEADIYILPKKYNDGKYFHHPEYLEWIRVYGDFNHYNYDEGVPFTLNDDGSVTAEITVDRDTIRYQLRGLAGGASVLPGAASYDQRPDGSFEATLIKPPGEETFKIHYDPSEEFPYPRMGNSRDPVRLSKNAFINFKNLSDRNWVEPLILRNIYYTSIKFIESTRDISAEYADDEDLRDMTMGRYLLKQIDKSKKQVESEIEKGGHHQQQLAALYVAYAGLLAQEKHYMSYPDDSEPEFEINQSLLEKIIRDVPAVHPLWAGRFSPVILAEVLECNTQSVRYIEEMAEHHQNDDVFRETVLFLTTLHANRYSDAEEMPYYQWVIRRYGDRNLARRVRNTFREVSTSEAAPDLCRRVDTR
ncbi:MAG: carboxypeptidase-like regulatory domain-containing protein [Balneolaceae bacterium]